MVRSASLCRMWRKTREPANSNWTSDFSSDSASDTALSYCHFSDMKGTDGNRNFDMRWGEYASKYACDDDFKVI